MQMNDYASLVARRALARYYLHGVMVQKSSKLRGRKLCSLSFENALSIIILLVEDVATVGPIKSQFQSNSHCAAELLLSIEDSKFCRALIWHLSTASAADVFAAMSPVDAMACLDQFSRPIVQAKFLAAMDPIEASAILDVSGLFVYLSSIYL